MPSISAQPLHLCGLAVKTKHHSPLSRRVQGGCADETVTITPILINYFNSITR